MEFRYGCDEVAPRLPQSHSQLDKEQFFEDLTATGASPSKGWFRALQGCFRATPRQVHSFQEKIVKQQVKRDADNYDHVAVCSSTRSEVLFASLPNHILEGILAALSGCSRLTHFNLCSVSRTWRQLGRKLYFSAPWSEPRLYCHPAQLFCLSPRPVDTNRSGLLKCFVRRDMHPGCSGVVRRYCVYMGRDHRQMRKTRFLLCAIQVTRCEMHVYFNREGRGLPVGILTANSFCTRYSMALAPGVHLVNDSRKEGAAGRGHGTRAGMQSMGDGHGKGEGESCAGTGRAAEKGGAGVAAVVASAAKVAPAVLGTLQYRARLRGFMQPRRVDVELPPPSQLSFGLALPLLCGTAGSSEAQQQPRGDDTTLAPTRQVSESEQNKHYHGLQRSSTAASSSTETVHPQGRHYLGQRAEQQQQQQAPRGFSPKGGEGKEVQGGISEDAVSLCNKPPQWNAELRCWCLNFRGRVKQASVKNFQLMRSGDPSERVVLQFGKVERDMYIMDFDPSALTAFQAFSIALSTFHNKLAL